ncbi:MAG TPA: hypothetical protein DDX54_01810, partial [Rhodospirillaceae bacterium]|nr:hypothetical protein [Rhodospirillaceae bacterium]
MNLFGEEAAPGAEEGGGSAIPSHPAGPGLAPPRAQRPLIGHVRARAVLLDMVRAGRLPHGAILAGPRGVGKATAAFALARFLLSGGGGDALDAPEGHPVHARVAAGGEPDLLTIEPDAPGATLKVDAVRAIAHFAHHTAAQAGGWRVVVVDDADAMTRAAQNALLKVLEEPPPRSIVLLVAHRPGALLPTIRSRAALVPFCALSESEMGQVLALADPPLAAGDMPLLAALSGGSAGRALAYAAADAPGIWARVEPLLGREDWPAAHALADQMAGKAAE